MRRTQVNKTLTRKLDEIFSKFVRKSNAKDGLITCYCGFKVVWEESDASHYIDRRHLSLRYDERNVHPSCRSCNRFKGGNLSEYALFLEERYGQGILQELERGKQEIAKNYPFQEKIDHYTTLYNAL